MPAQSRLGVVERYVAIGDSFTEGVGDELEDGSPRGWADLVATELGVEYANLAVRGKLLGSIIDDQLDAALGLRPDLVSFAGGGNDVLRPRADPRSLSRLLDLAVARLVDSGARVVLFTGADPFDHLPMGGRFRAHAELFAERARKIAEHRGAVLVDLWAVQELRDARFWSVDRLHLNTAGHRRVAARVLETLGGPVPTQWTRPVAAIPPALRPIRSQVDYYRDHVGPWVRRRLTGTSSGDNRQPKRPVPAPMSRS